MSDAQRFLCGNLPQRRATRSALAASRWSTPASPIVKRLPHTDLRTGMPNDDDLVDLLGARVDDDAVHDAVRDAILVTNPALLYRP